MTQSVLVMERIHRGSQGATRFRVEHRAKFYNIISRHTEFFGSWQRALTCLDLQKEHGIRVGQGLEGRTQLNEGMLSCCLHCPDAQVVALRCHWTALESPGSMN